MAGAGTVFAAGVPAVGEVPAEMTAALANMLEAALAAGLVPAPAGEAPPGGQREAGDDAGRAEDRALAPGPGGDDLPVI
jgi:hypothetical protein